MFLITFTYELIMHWQRKQTETLYYRVSVRMSRSFLIKVAGSLDSQAPHSQDHRAVWGDRRRFPHQDVDRKARRGHGPALGHDFAKHCPTQVLHRLQICSPVGCGRYCSNGKVRGTLQLPTTTLSKHKTLISVMTRGSLIKRAL